jgi:hypothetical protein
MRNKKRSGSAKQARRLGRQKWPSGAVSAVSQAINAARQSYREEYRRRGGITRIGDGEANAKNGGRKAASSNWP